MAELVDLLTARAILGFVDNFRQDFEVNPVDFYKSDLMRWSKTRFIGRFVLGIAVFLGSSVLGFASLFWGVYVVWGEICFRNLLPNALPQLQFIYLSIITAATVGYGDISPACGISQTVAALECIFTMSVIVALLFALSNTFSHEGG